MDCLTDMLRPVAWAYSALSSPAEREIIARKNISHRAITAGKLYCSLRLRIGAGNLRSKHYWPAPYWYAGGDSELANVFCILANQPTLLENWDLFSDHNKWALHVIPQMRPSLRGVTGFLDQLSSENVPRLDGESFADYICCLCSLFGAPANTDILRRPDRGWASLP
ncbi:hypothetical protein C8R46DRAFT_1057408 [Mycena filopes]|nr:hypothetical protein C8R46DRAFT_1057408 [Mycena filopes]